nr:pesticin C-terminus-like muramidase [Massilia sp. CCM 8734]
MSKNIPRLAGAKGKKPENRSGVTVGIGVDLGQDSPNGFLQKMKRRNTGTQKIPEEELIRLHEKITPYFQKFGGEACQFLRENPLVLTLDESHFLNKVAHGELLNKTIQDYSSIATKKGAKKFTELPTEQQTALLLDGYNRGTVSEDLINAVIRGNNSVVHAALNRK